MALVINHNLSSITAQRNLAGTTRSLSSSFEKVSSGLRINKAADDAARLGVAETLTFVFFLWLSLFVCAFDNLKDKNF